MGRAPGRPLSNRYERDRKGLCGGSGDHRGHNRPPMRPAKKRYGKCALPEGSLEWLGPGGRGQCRGTHRGRHLHLHPPHRRTGARAAYPQECPGHHERRIRRATRSDRSRRPGSRDMASHNRVCRRLPGPRSALRPEQPAVGRTTQITGNLTIRGDAATAASFTVKMATIHSDQSQRDAQFDGRIMDVSAYPTGVFTLTPPSAWDH